MSFPFFAAAIPPRPLSPEELDRLPSLTRMLYGEEIWQGIVVVAAALAVGALVMLLMFFLRRRGRDMVAPGRAEEPHNPFMLEDQGTGFFKFFTKRKRRKRRRHRPRNPTLAETGGLPPRRDDAPSAPRT